MDDSDIEEELEELAVALAAAGYYISCMSKRPRRNSALPGAAFVNEILRGRSECFRDICRMELHVFEKLCEIIQAKGLLRDTTSMKIEEQLAMFLFTLGHNASNRQVQERFQHSGETISRHFNNALNAITELSSHFLQLPSSNTPPQILHQSQYYPYFENCIGAVDGIHIPVTVGLDKQVPFRNRKGFLSQNVMAACSFDLRFLYVLAGWEGSAADSTVLRAALRSGFRVPEGKYYLVDAGYPNMPGFMAPYRGVRYHLNEFARGGQPQNAQELFNYRHSSLRNAIECIFAVLKARFPIIKLAPPYPFQTQVKLVIAVCILHNHIRGETGGDDWLYEEYDNEIHNQPCDSEVDSEAQALQDASISLPDASLCRQRNAACTLRDAIATAMWDDHLNHR